MTPRRFRPVDGLATSLSAWLVARGAVAVGIVVAVVTADELVPGRRPLQLDQGLFAWDGAFYRDIADYGYGALVSDKLRFFPLLPLIARALSVPFAGSVGVALIVIANVAALVAGVLLYRLTMFERGDRRLADRTVWIFMLFPSAAVLVLGYAESLLLVLSVGSFLALRRGRWWTAAALGLLAGMCRPLGIALAVPAAIEAMRGLRSQRGMRLGSLTPRLAAVTAPVIGCGAYLLWVEREYGDGLLPLRLQNTTELRGGWNNPLSTVIDAFRSVGNDALGEALHLPWIIAFLVLLVLVARQLPSSYAAYSGVLLLAALTGHTLGSFERYGLAAFPLVMVLAFEVTRTRTEFIAIAVCATGLTAFTTLEMLGAFVP